MAMYELNELFFYKPLFMFELLLGESLFVFNLNRRDHFLLRIVLSCLGCFALSFLFPMFFYNPIYLSFMCLFFAAMTFVALEICFSSKAINLIFCVLSGYAVEHLSYSVYQLLMVITLLDGGNSLDIYGSGKAVDLNGFVISIYLEIFCLVYFASYLLFGRQMKKDNDFFITNNWLFLLLLLLFVSAVSLNAVVVYACDIATDRIALGVTFLYSIINCVLILALMFKLKSEKKAKKELEFVRHMWAEDKEHYQLAKENIKIINIKCHDLKHQIRALNSGGIDPEELKQLESSLSIYDSICKTENPALDVVLGEKSLLCNKKHIVLTYMVDGKSLSFMKDYEIYSLFGNALDNAIEYLDSIDESKRFIRLNIKEVSHNLSIHVENYFEGKLEFEDGLPKTTKEDKNYHGFGMLSISELVKSYHGDLFVKADGNLFSIDILIPLVREE